MNWYKKSQSALFIEPEDVRKIISLVNKIRLGKTDWTEEELQLQQNYPHIIEKILKQHSA